MSDLPSLPSPTPLSPGKELALAAAHQLIGVAGFAAMCGIAWLLWRALWRTDGGGGGGTPKHYRVDETPDAAPTPPVHEERREAHVVVTDRQGRRTVVASGPASRAPFIIPGEGIA